MSKRREFGEELAREIAAADLGDPRRSRRAGKIVERMVVRPEASFPAAMKSEAELEAAYRFLTNEHVDPSAILEPHIEASCERASAFDDVLVLHDTTFFVFEGERDGLGRILRNNRGFWAHFAMAARPNRESLGVVGMLHGVRTGPARWKDNKRVKGVGEGEPSEAMRWPALVMSTASRFGRGRVVHVMDREADWFELLQLMLTDGERFVVRLTHDRLLQDEGRVSDLLAGASVMARREVQLSARARGDTATQRKRQHPERAPRMATLDVKAVSATIRGAKSPGLLKVNVVSVVEVDVPEGLEPVKWNLITTEPIATADDLLRIVDAYRTRWVIEEFFKAIKTGCAFEKRQLGSYEALVNALAVFAPIAWFLLRLRDLGRHHPTTPASAVLSAELLLILGALARRPLPENPTVRDAMFAIAGLGGHLPRNGDPGWQTLGRGFEQLLTAQRVAAKLAKM
jgi:hypothetical protein